MTNGRRLLDNINVLNIFLVLVVFVMANYAVAPLLHVNPGDIMPLQKKGTEEKETKPAVSNPPSPADYVIIAEENPFHPERKIPPEKKADEKPLPKPEFVVYGTVISDDTSLAYIEDLKAPVNTAGRGKRQITLKKGDVLSGFTLKTVEADKIVMVRGEEKMVIPVHNISRTKSSVQPSPQKTAPSATKSALSPGSLVRQAPPTRTRAPLTPADEKARQFFQR